MDKRISFITWLMYVCWKQWGKDYICCYFLRLYRILRSLPINDQLHPIKVHTFCWESDLYFTSLICGVFDHLVFLHPFFVFCLTRSNCWQQLIVEGSEHSAQKSDPHCCLWWALMTWSPLIHCSLTCPLYTSDQVFFMLKFCCHLVYMCTLKLHSVIGQAGELKPASRRERQQLLSHVLECRKA
jgi:hypothetical protein